MCFSRYSDIGIRQRQERKVTATVVAIITCHVLTHVRHPSHSLQIQQEPANAHGQDLRILYHKDMYKNLISDSVDNPVYLGDSGSLQGLLHPRIPYSEQQRAVQCLSHCQLSATHWKGTRGIEWGSVSVSSPSLHSPTLSL